MTIRNVKTIKGPKGTVRVKFSEDWGEFRAILEGQPDATYFTPDRDDAIGTARMMAGLTAEER